MPRLFVEKAPVPVYEFDDMEKSDSRQNVVYIKPRMSYHDRAVYLDVLYHREISVGTDGDEMQIFQAKLQLLKLLVVRWQGPDFQDEMGRPLPYSPSLLDDIDPFEPFWDKILSEIDARNKPRTETPDPNGSPALVTSPSPSATANSSAEPETALAPDSASK